MQLNLLPTIQQAISNLLTVYEPEFLRFGYLPAAHEPFDRISVRCPGLAAMRRGQVKPHVREDVVLRHTLTIGIHGSEFILRRDVTSVRSKAIPFHGFSEVLRHALAFQVHFRETILGEGYALIPQRTGIPFCRSL